MAQSFGLQVRAWCDKAAEGSDRAMQDICIGVGSRIVTRTPVLTGKAKGNWDPAVNAEPEAEEREIFDKSGAVTIAKIIAAARTLKAGDVFYLANGVSYIRPLEYGHSKQALQGMVRVTIAEYQIIVDAAVKEEA